MFTLSQVLCDPTVALIYTMIVRFLIQLFMLNTIFMWLDIKVESRKVMLCALCGVMLEIFPIIIVNLVIPDPLEARVWIYRVCMYVNPLYCLIYYAITRYGLKFSPTRALIVMHYQILISYMITTLMLFLNDFFCWTLQIEEAPDQFFPPDYLSFIVILGIWCSVWCAMKVYLRRSNKHIVIPPNYADKNIAGNFLNVFLTACLVYVVTAFFRIHWVPDISNPLNFATALIYFLLISSLFFFLLNTTSKLRNRFLEWEMQATGTYISSLLHTNQEFRAIKHDFYNVLQGYGGYLEIKDYKGLSEYHKKLFTTTRQAGDFLSIIEVLRSRIAVYSLLETMSEKARKANVSFSINSICDVTDIVLDDVDLCRVMGVVIDNAIEEATISTDQQVDLSFERKDEVTIVLAVSNTTKEDVEISQIFQVGYTTKHNHTGIGLPQALHILNSYEHCSIRANYHDNQFTIFLILNAS